MKLKLKKAETFEEFVKKQEEKEDVILIAVSQVAIWSGFGTVLILLLYPSALDWLNATVGYSICGISTVIFAWLLKKYDKPAEARYIKKYHRKIEQYNKRKATYQ